MDDNIVIYFYQNPASVERKLGDRNFASDAAGQLLSYRPPDQNLLYTFHLAPNTIQERDSWLMCMRPFQRNIICILVDDQDISSVSMELISDIAKRYGLAEPQRVIQFIDR